MAHSGEVKTFRLMWSDFCHAWRDATPLARTLLVIFAVLIVGWTGTCALVAIL